MNERRTSREHLLFELDRIDTWIRLQVWRAQPRPADGGAPIAPDGVTLAGPAGLPRWVTVQDFPSSDWPEAWEALGLERERWRHDASSNGTMRRLDRLKETFGLTAFDLDLVVLCMAAEIDLRYDDVFAFLQGTTGERRLTVDLALNLFSRSLDEKLEAGKRLFPDSPLVRHRLVRLDDEGASQGRLLAQRVRLDERVVRYLLDSDEIDPRLAPFVRRPQRGDHGERADVAPSTAGADVTLVERALTRRTASTSLIVHLRESREGDGESLASAACRRAGLDLLVADGERLGALTDPPEMTIGALAREAALSGAALYVGDAGAVMNRYLDAIARVAVYMPCALFVSHATPWEPSLPSNVDLLMIDVSLPSGDERLALWRACLPVRGPALDAELDAVAAKFRFGAAQLRGAAEGAMRRGRARADESGPTVDDLYESCRARSSHAIEDLARRIRPHYRWEDIVLPEDSLRQLREICERVVHYPRVLDQWGFAGKLSLGRGLNVLFAGPSGTGKTMAAEIMARELRLDLFRIDLSSIVSKYIGETEKNLSKVFGAAETSNAILFFDEADALFGKRSEVKDAHDRYANIETSYLLQRMEEYEGITILATNLRRNLDDAFARRMAFTITFPMPEEEQRLRLWKQVWPVDTPTDVDIDLGFLAKQFKFSGGNIKNIVVAAAFLAASDGGTVAMRHVVRATRRELQKLGKTSASGDFGPYAGHDVA